MLQQHLYRALWAVGAIVIIVGFQDCSSVMRGQKASQSLGGGTEGKVYQNYATCTTDQVGLSAAVVIAADGKSALMTRQSCQQLNKPLAVDPANLTKGFLDSSVFALNGQVFDQQTTSGEQRLTVKFCRSSAAEVMVWQVTGHTAGLSGRISLPNGSTTGVLSVQSPFSNEFASASGQASQFDLKIANDSTATLSYAIDGGSTVTLSNLSCATQTAPPALAPATPPPNSTITNGSQLTPSNVGPEAIGITAFQDTPGGSLNDGDSPSFARQISTSATYDGFTVTGPHLLIEGWNFGDTLDIYTSQTVVVRGCKFRFGSSDLWNIGIRPSAGKVYVLYSDIGGVSSTAPGNYGIMDMHGGSIVYRNHLSKTWTALSASDGSLVAENYVDDFVTSNGNGVLANTVANFQFLRNKILLNKSSTCAICLYTDYGANSQITSDSNYLAGGGYTIYGGAKGSSVYSTGIAFTNNILGLDFGSLVGGYGPLTYWASTPGSGNVWTGNTYSDGSPLVNYPNGGAAIPTN